MNILIILFLSFAISQSISYPIIDTGVETFYNNNQVIAEPNEGEAFYGQDATYSGLQPSYTNNGNGIITDNNTGLMWEQFMGEKLNYLEAITKADTSILGGFTDWRVPTLKELYSLILFTGESLGEQAIYMYIDTNYFDQPLGDVTIGEREIDAQTWSSTEYVGETMMGTETIFGVNFVDGRIKGYPKYKPPQFIQLNKMYFRMVRGNNDYGTNSFVDNNNGTISDLNTGLMWQKANDDNFYDWENAILFSENFELSGYTDWRLPNPKELHSIIDYTRCPDITNSPAIDPIFYTTEIYDPSGIQNQYPYFWTGTTHINSPNPYSTAAYFAFGEAQGMINNQLMDVHGAGAQRSDYKFGNPEDFPSSMGPQGDIHYVFNAVRCVRNILHQMGDLNNDSQINVMDIIIMVNIILGDLIPTNQQFSAGELNGDGIINVVDVIVLVNMILGQ
ncbi:MAG: DUF1566 domain-containing protein [Candidatus Marinimicrobia bacterium]|nr:DUF1566 domain-containing protein [Candidatus Neomarinimicrobiota bacterium]